MESITLKGWRKVQLVITTDSFGELKFEEQIRRLYHTGGRQILMMYTLAFQRFKMKFIKLSLIYL